MRERESIAPEERHAEFTSTHWSVVLAARDSAPAAAAEALETLCRAYWYPLYVYIRRNGHSPQDAEDLTQTFFVHLLTHDFLRNVAPDKGRFRSFLLACLKRFLTSQWRRGDALKRQAMRHAWSLDQQDAESRYLLAPAEMNDPEKLYERRWALTTLERVLEKLEGEAVAAGKQRLYLQLQPFLTGDRDKKTYAQIGRELGTTEGAIKMSVLRMRERLRVLFSEEIAHTVATPVEVPDEIRHLLAVLSETPVPGRMNEGGPGVSDSNP